MTRRLGATSPICCGHCATAPTRRARPRQADAFSDCWGLRRYPDHGFAAAMKLRRAEQKVADHRRGRGRRIAVVVAKPGGSSVPDSRSRSQHFEHQCIVWGPGAQSTGTPGGPQTWSPQQVRHRRACQGPMPPSCSARGEITRHHGRIGHTGRPGRQRHGLHRISCPGRTAWNGYHCRGTGLRRQRMVGGAHKLTESQPDDGRPCCSGFSRRAGSPRPTWLARSTNKSADLAGMLGPGGVKSRATPGH